jgi:Mlc titration factor MtfA (ptsG expression regulator)
MLHESGDIVSPEEPLDGEAWQSGTVVLGWDAVKRTAGVATDGDNVVLHEFAHMLDAESGSLDGIPVLDSGAAYRAWTALLSVKFAEHAARVDKGEATVLDPYGAEDRAEFFAVATEAYFENPVALRQDQPDLYALLLDFYKIDPAPLVQPTRGSTAGR